MGGQHRLLDRIGGVLGGQAAPPGNPVQPWPVPAEQFLEGVAVTGGVRAEQIGVGSQTGSGCGGGAGHERGR